MKTISIPNLLGYLAVLLGVYLISGQASASSTLVCETAFGQKKIIIKDKTVSFEKEDYKGKVKLISVNKIETTPTLSGFTKVLSFEGYTHKIHIQDSRNPASTEDYLSITSNQGHQITYPLSCQQT